MTIPRFEVNSHARLLVNGQDHGPNAIDAVRNEGGGWEYQIGGQWHPEHDLEPLNTSSAVGGTPPVPEGVLLPPSAGDGAGVWIDTYVDYARAISPMTPDLFHQSAGLWLTSAVIARRLVLPMAWGPVYPNLFIAWIAPSTLFRKTTALSLARTIASTHFRHLLVPEEFTPESLLSDMAGSDPINLGSLPRDTQELWPRSKDYAAQRAWSLDEFSGLLVSAGRDYNRGLIEALLRFYDCESHFTRSTRGQGRLDIRSTYLTFIGATTPTGIAPHLTAETLWGNGWWPRFALLTPETPRLSWETSQHREMPSTLVQTLNALDARLPVAKWPNSPQALRISLSADVDRHFEILNRALSYDLLGNGSGVPLRLYASYGRLPVMALKVATILAALDWQASASVPTIELAHLARAEAIIEDWRQSLHRAITRSAENDREGLVGRVLRHVSRYGRTGQTASQLYSRHMKDKSTAEVEAALTLLERRGEVESFEPPRPNGGRPTRYWRVSG